MEKTNAEHGVLWWLRKLVRADDPGCMEHHEREAAENYLQDLNSLVDERVRKMLVDMKIVAERDPVD